MLPGMPSDPTTPQPYVDDGDPYIPDAGSTQLTGLALGIDVGGTGVKAALVDLATAELVSPRVREKTPQPSTPDAVAQTIRSVIEKALDGRDVPADLPVGCGLPGVVKNGRLTTAANIDPGWVDWPAEERIGEAIGRRTRIINDADAAGLAEVAYGAGRDRPGTVLLLTLGTGIGSALFLDGCLVPNTEFGHLEMHGRDAETLVSGAARERRKLGWKRWAREFNGYIARVELYFSPDLLIYGGGVSKEWSKWGRWSETKAPVVLARFLNTSGIIGAAYAAAAAQHAERETAAVSHAPGGETHGA
jgi:polyphosphate glucokinase